MYVAVIKPIQEKSSQDAALRAMADEGLITLPSRKRPMPKPRWRPVKIKGTSVSQAVLEDREDRA